MGYKIRNGVDSGFPSSIDIAVGKSEINTLENYLNSDASLVDKCLSILEHQKTSPLPISFRDFTIGSIEKKIELECQEFRCLQELELEQN